MLNGTRHTALLAVLMTIAAATVSLTFTKARAEAPATTQPARLTFPDAVTIRNDAVVVSVSPRAGRITHFGRVDGPNLLWINTEEGNKPNRARGHDYYNVGGDKVWPLLQALWGRAYGSPEGWPPDGVIDGQPWTLVERSDRSLTIESPLSPQVGIKVRRRITLADAGPRVDVTNTVVQVEPGVYPVHVWTISHVGWPQHVLMDIASDRVAGPEWVDFGAGTKLKGRVHVQPDLGVLRFDVTPDRSLKTGTLGRWLAAVWAEDVLVQTTAFDPKGMYPDGSTVQVYYDPNYTELELLGPTKHLQPGESLEQRMTWHLLPRDQMDDAAIVAKARELAGGAAR